MSIPLARRLFRRSPTQHAPPPPGGPSRLYLTLAAEGADPSPEQRSLPRRAFILFAAVLVLLLAPLSFVSMAQGADQPQAVLVKASDDDDDERDDDGDGDGKGKDDTTGDNDTGTGRETAAANTDQPGLETGASTNGETDQDGTGKTETGHTTGAETRAANTDRPGLKTGVSTRGETDPGDNTGKTERR
jgi:hypothetical protein